MKIEISAPTIYFNAPLKLPARDLKWSVGLARCEGFVASRIAKCRRDFEPSFACCIAFERLVRGGWKNRGGTQNAIRVAELIPRLRMTETANELTASVVPERSRLQWIEWREEAPFEVEVRAGAAGLRSLAKTERPGNYVHVKFRIVNHRTTDGIVWPRRRRWQGHHVC